MKTVLVPTDFSETSKKAIEYVVQFFEDMAGVCKLILLHSYSVPKTEDFSKVVEINDMAKSKAKSRLEDEVQWAQNLSQDRFLEVEPILHMGSLESVISQVLKDNKVDLIVMGKDGGEHVEQIYKILKHNKFLSPLLIVFN